jgi:AcrR family transcriptional regulator
MNDPLDRTLWERRPPMSRDRSSLLTRREIAAAAFAVAEAENLQAVSIKRVAGRLGIPAIRLEGYLADRAELLDLMVDEALGEVEIAGIPETADWRSQLWQIATALRGAVQRRPWLSGLLGLRPPSGPNGLRFTERCLQAMAFLGTDIGTAAQCVESVIVFVCGSVRPGAVAVPVRRPNAPAALAAYLAAEVTPQAYPRLSQLLANPSALSPDEAFAAGLTYLLSGMAGELADLARLTDAEHEPRE